ncbi:chemotaxis protein CheW [Shewanella sp. 5_MG-2023]|uniref:chemotaxis protein CheW n=1 Tax=Shewanella sp. 5_MG-2023 TaxID=3062656 RepID=UPI0026E1E513|nr:chemotaxis protein CheW [Shewanella sp. 5_MG-2023]MDO6641131.1 chemotaxis protein CheW [Shewanella sp. 5_MG-2023]
MSKSVDETVFDFFSVLLQEPSDKALDAATSCNKQTSISRLQVAQHTDSTSSTEVAEIYEGSLHNSEDKYLHATTKLAAPSLRLQTVATLGESLSSSFAEPQVDKNALSKLLAVVSAPVSTTSEQCVESPLEVKQVLKGTVQQAKLPIAQPAALAAKLSVVDNKDSQISADIDNHKRAYVETAVIDVSQSPAKAELASIPPSITTDLQDVLDDEFQVLFFNVAGLTLAVPLVSLGGIVKIEHINHLIGRPKWFLGVQTRRDQKVNVVDSCRWVMPEKYTTEMAQSIDYQYIVMLENSDWGLACESLVNAVKINKSHVNWREKAGKRPWLAGVVKEQMCGILNVQALIEMLDAGLGCQDSIV